MSIVIFIIILAVLVFVHELGHFLTARLFGVRADAFAIGFGPKIWAWRPKNKKGEPSETEYSIRAIPFGGFVKIFGEDPDTESLSGPDSQRSFVNKPRWQQAIVLFAGVFFNFVLACLIYIFLFSYGVSTDIDTAHSYFKYTDNKRVIVTSVLENSPAYEAGLRMGDIIENTDSASVFRKDIEDSNGAYMDISYIHKGVSKTVSLVPIRTSSLINNNKEELGNIKIDESKDNYAIGITMQDTLDLHLPPHLAIYEGFKYTGKMMYLTTVGIIDFIGQIFVGRADFNQVSGPVGLVGIVGDAFNVGLKSLLMLTAIISINLGIINLLPFPALDGGRIVVVGIESIIRRKLPSKYLNIVNSIGFILLILLMIVVTYKDIMKLF